MPFGMGRAMPGVPLAQPHPLFALFPVIFDSLYYKIILSNLTKTFEIVRIGAKCSKNPPKVLAVIWPLFGNFLVIFWIFFFFGV
jgi:hypothetical protein